MNTVVIKSIDRDKVQTAAVDLAKKLRFEHPEICRIIWFGSWVNGYPSPGSDVDLCVIVSKSDLPRRERAVNYLPLGFPVGIDLFVYTEIEFELLSQTSPGWKLEIAKGIDL